ncbi:MAG: hypothetical protein ACRDPD_15240 [Streptosporangiaceae bacterium]
MFRRVSVFPAPFTLEAAEAVAGQDAGPGVLRLVDYSLLAPPRAGPDGRSRYLMLETLRGHGLGRLAEAGEGDQASAAMARYAAGVTGQAAAGLQAAPGELAALRWLDAEDALTRHALAWALDHDQDAALGLALGLFPWWRLRGRLPDGEPLLRAAAGHAEPGTGVWGEAQCRLGQMAMSAGDYTTALGHFTAARDAGTDQPVLADGLAGRCVALANLGRTAEAVEDGQRALAIARGLRYPVGEALALNNLAIATYYVGNVSDAVGWARQAQRIDRKRIPGAVARVCDNILALVLIAVGEFAAAGRCCATALDSCRQVGDPQTQAALLTLLGHLDLDAGRLTDAAARLQEAVQVALRISDETELLNCIDNCGHLCAAAGRWADATTLWAALAAYSEQAGLSDPQDDALRRREPQREAARALGLARTREAEHRGAAMTLATAAEFAAMLTTADPEATLTAADAAAAEAPQPAARLSRRERELVTLVAQGCTDAQIKEQARCYLQPGEQVLAALIARARGATMASAGNLAGNAIGGRKVVQQRRAAEDAGLKLTSPMALAMTDQRLLVLKISPLLALGKGGDVKELVSDVPVADVDSIEIKRLLVGTVVTVTVRGTPVKLEAGATGDAKGMADGLARAKSAA